VKAGKPSIAIKLADQEVELIELDGGFGSLCAAKIFETIGGRSAVGFVSFGNRVNGEGGSFQAALRGAGGVICSR
jgi:hypothetical protein